MSYEKSDLYLVKLLCTFDSNNINIILSKISEPIKNKLIYYCNIIISNKKGNKELAQIILNNIESKVKSSSQYNKLIITKEDQYNFDGINYFKYKSIKLKTPKIGEKSFEYVPITVREINKNINKNLRMTLEQIATDIGCLNCSKLKKNELVKIVEENIIFL